MLPIKAQVGLLFMLLFFVSFLVSLDNRFSNKLGNLGPKCDNVCAVFIKSFINAEILRCKYNDTYNFGTFQISINRFINNLRTIELPYSISYLEDNSKNDSFIWINYFYTEDYEDILLKNWANKEDSAEIQNEFSTNATCIDSKKYKSYKLI